MKKDEIVGWQPKRQGQNLSPFRPAPKPQSTDPRVDINTATVEALTTLKGIGKATAERIVVHRTVEPFKCVDDLSRVGGINTKLIDRIRAEVRV